MTKTLRIKRVYFDAIRRAEKTYELRADTDFYRKMFKESERVNMIMFHYQGKERLYCEVESIRKVKTPDIAKSVILTEKCFKLKLGKIRHEK